MRARETLNHWNATPLVTSVHTGSPDSPRYARIKLWCRAKFGAELTTETRAPARWRASPVTIDGLTCFGFRSRGDMEAFQQEWGGR